MRRINSSDGLYHNADPTNGVAGTIVTAEALNALQEEIIAVITAAGQELDDASTRQLLDAILAITGGGSLPWGAITNKPATFPPSAHTHTMAGVIGLVDALAALAPLQSPDLAGTPTAPTAAAGTNNSQLANTAFVVSAFNSMLTAAFSGSSQQLTGNGFQKFPGGLILQWMNLDLSGTSTVSTLPIAFPTGFLWAAGLGKATPEYAGWMPSASTTQISLTWNTSPGACLALALGH